MPVGPPTDTSSQEKLVKSHYPTALAICAQLFLLHSLARGIPVVEMQVAHAQGQANPNVLREVSFEGDQHHVVIRLAGEAPLAGELRELSTPPFRVFLDLVNVRPGVAPVTVVGKGGVRQVRVALNQADPPVTRVVLDLEKPSTYRLQKDATRNVLTITVGEPRDDVLAYTAWFDRTSGKLRRLLKQETQASGNTAPLVATWKTLQVDSEAVHAPRPLRVAHDLLETSINLGLAAAEQRREGRASADVAAAHASAVMLLARAQAIVDGSQFVAKQ